MTLSCKIPWKLLGSPPFLMMRTYSLVLSIFEGQQMINFRINPAFHSTL